MQLSLRPGWLLIAENFFLRRQLALYKERGIQPWRTDPATRVSLRLIELLQPTALYRGGGGQGN